MRIRRSPREIFSKISGDTLAEVTRLFQNVQNPFVELQTFLGLKEITPDKQVRIRGGYVIPIRTQHDFQQAFWDCWVRKPYPVRPTDRVVVDAGANIGCFVMYVVARAPHAQVYALEPSSSNYARLQELIQVNRIENRVKAYPFGVARNTGELSLNVGVDSAYHTSFGPSAQGSQNEKIKVYSLADLFRELGIPGSVDLLKMDCEGAEMDCILGADAETLSRVKRLELEYHEWAGFSFQEVRERLEKSGLRLTVNDENSADRTGNATFERA